MRQPPANVPNISANLLGLPFNEVAMPGALLSDEFGEIGDIGIVGEESLTEGIL